MSKALQVLSSIGVIVLLLLGGYFLFREPNVAIVQTDVVRIGWIGHGDHLAVNLALKDLNSTEFEVVFLDVACDRADVLEASRGLIDQGVVVVVSELCSDYYYDANVLFAENDVVMIQAGSSLTDYIDEPMFRTAPHQKQAMAFGIDYLRSKGIDNIGIIGVPTKWSQDLIDLTRDLFEKEGRTFTVVYVTQDDGRALDDETLKISLEALKETDPDIVYMIAPADEVVRVLAIAKEIKLDATMYGVSELYDDADALGDVGDNLRIVAISTGSSGFVEQYKSAYGQDALPYSASAYDAVIAVSKVLRLSDATQDDIVAKLYELNFEGASGLIDFADNGHIPGRFEVHVLQSGKFIKK